MTLADFAGIYESLQVRHYGGRSSLTAKYSPRAGTAWTEHRSACAAGALTGTNIAVVFASGLITGILLECQHDVGARRGHKLRTRSGAWSIQVHSFSYLWSGIAVREDRGSIQGERTQTGASSISAGSGRRGAFIP